MQEGFAESLHNDYGIVAKFTGPNNNVILLFASFHDTGIIECVKQFSRMESLHEIESEIKTQHGLIPSSFEILFKVIGLNRNDLNSKIIKINRMDTTSIFWDVK